MKEKHRIAVRTLVEFTLRAGDLNQGFTGQNRSLEGIRAHQQIQQDKPEDYRPEVPISHTIETDTFILEITGRIDGVYHSPERVIVEEIKSTTHDPDTMERWENPLHWGQLKLYAYLYAHQNGLSEIETYLTYYQIETEKVTRIERRFDVEDLGTFFRDILERYVEYVENVSNWASVRDASIADLPFPYPDYRKGQERMIDEVRHAVREGGHLIIQAPTGIGKTMAVLFPAIEAVAEGRTSKIFYLTARTTGRTVALKAVDTLREEGLRLKTLVLTAKEKICFTDHMNCTALDCRYARGYFDRIRDALKAAAGRDSHTKETVEAVAERFRVCPFELSLDLALQADLIICDYNYAFDPNVYLKRFFLEETGNAYTFLVDEAHNLPERAREMFSAELTKKAFLDVRRAVKKDVPELYRILGIVDAWFRDQRKITEEAGGYRTEIERPAEIDGPLLQFIEETEDWLSKRVNAPYRDMLLNLYFDAGRFLKTAAHYDRRYVTCFERSGSDLKMKLYCIDPSFLLRAALKRSRTAVFFSATMTPADYFITILGCDGDTPNLDLPSPFPEENLRLLVCDSISTYYKNRDNTKGDVAEAVVSLVRSRKGNYLVFFPSYAYMKAVLEVLAPILPFGADVLVQKSGMSEEARDLFLQRFSGSDEGTRVGFAVMGGIFGEGIDLVGDRLTGAVIVGVGLPAITPERELIKNYFTDEFHSGFAYAYAYPGINRVFQAAGRVIRSESDRGVVLLIDERYSRSDYRRLFPDHWNPVHVRDREQVAEIAADF